VSKTQGQIKANLRVLEARWAGLILWALMHEELRYGGIKARVPDITDRVLSRRLKELEDDGIVERHTIGSRPPAVWYRLSKAGQELKPIFQALNRWQLPRK